MPRGERIPSCEVLTGGGPVDISIVHFFKTKIKIVIVIKIIG
jgi:hypothetical protein